MRFICEECDDLVDEKEVIIQSINGRIRFLCQKHFDKWWGKEDDNN